MSKKIPVVGKYRGYRLNVYFEDIRKSITNVTLPLTKEHPSVRINDGVKVVKSQFGALHMICFDSAAASEKTPSVRKK